jgi:hypothetical protein
MNESTGSRAPVDRAARRNYLIMCVTGTLACIALVVGYIVMFSE